MKTFAGVNSPEAIKLAGWTNGSIEHHVHDSLCKIYFAHKEVVSVLLDDLVAAMCNRPGYPFSQMQLREAVKRMVIGADDKKPLIVIDNESTILPSEHFGFKIITYGKV